MEYKKSNNPQYDPTVQEIQTRLNYINNGRWIHLDPDGKFGPNTEKAVIAYQKSKAITPASGIVGDTTYGYLMNERYAVIGNPQPGFHTVHEPTDKRVYIPDPVNVYKGAETARTVLDIEKDGSVAYLVNEVDKIIKDQVKNLKGLLNQIDVKKRGRIPQLTKKLDDASQFITVARKQGIPIAMQQFFKNANKSSAVADLNQVLEIINSANVTKIISSASKFFQNINKIFRPLFNLLENLAKKFPLLQFIGAIQKFGDCMWQLIRGNSELALARFLECIKEIAVALALTALITAIGASGGWIPIVLILVIILAALLIDYFFFSANPGDSLADKYTPLRTRNVAEDFVYANYSHLD